MSNENLELFKGIATVYSISSEGVISSKQCPKTYCTLKHSSEFCANMVNIFDDNMLPNYTNVAPGVVQNNRIWYATDPGLQVATDTFKADYISRIEEKQNELDKLQEIYKGL